MRSPFASLLGPPFASLLLLAARPSLAGAAPVLAPASADQPALAARIEDGALRWRACPAADACVPRPDDARLPIPDAAAATLEVLAIGPSRSVVHLASPGFDVLLGAAPGTASESKVLFSGATGLAGENPAERTGAEVRLTRPDPSGRVHVLLGQARADLGLCGRPTLTDPKVLDARDLAWRGARVQQLPAEERDAAPELVAKLHDGPAPAPLGRVLSARAASSGTGSPRALTDGDPETTWSEGRGGDGNGELVQLDAPPHVPIVALSIAVRPPKRVVPHGAGPRRIWLATPDRLFAVRFPVDPWTKPGATWDVALPEPVRAGCLAVVLDESWGPSRGDEAVTLAELTARTVFDGETDLAGLAGALAGGSERSRGAAEVLASAGEPGQRAAIAAYPSLDEAGRRLVLDVIDVAPCELAAPTFVQAAFAGSPMETRHAQDHLRRCGRAAAPALLAALASEDPRVRGGAGRELALLAPADAPGPLLEAIAKTGPGKTRDELRAALAHAARSERAADAVRALFASPSTPDDATLELLRASSTVDLPPPEAGAALARVAARARDFRTRWLLVAPAGRLARAGDAEAARLVAASLDPAGDPHLRAGAARAAAGVPSLAAPLVRAVDDAEPRVREAAVGALAATPDAAAIERVAARLASDPWTFVRLAATRTLATGPASAATDRALAVAATHDRVPAVRARALDALAERRAVGEIAAVRTAFAEDDAPEVRARAALALGATCDAASVGALAGAAKRAASAVASPAVREVGLAAIGALGRLHPPDLAARLAPLLGEAAPPGAREAAKAALEAPGACR